MPPESTAFQRLQLLLFGVLALLVGNAAAGLASGLAGSLALAAAAVLGAVTQVTGLDGLDMFHDSTSTKSFKNSCLKLCHNLELKSIHAERKSGSEGKKSQRFGRDAARRNCFACLRLCSGGGRNAFICKDYRKINRQLRTDFFRKRLLFLVGILDRRSDGNRVVDDINANTAE